jgi:hypothetical protein
LIDLANKSQQLKRRSTKSYFSIVGEWEADPWSKISHQSVDVRRGKIAYQQNSSATTTEELRQIVLKNCSD